MSEYANIFEQVVDGMQIGNVNYTEIIYSLGANVQNIIINNNIIHYLMNIIYRVIHDNNVNDNNMVIYCEDLAILYNSDQLEMALSLLTMVREINPENIGININNTLIETYLIQLRETYSDEELDTACTILRFCLTPTIFNYVNLLSNNHINYNIINNDDTNDNNNIENYNTHQSIINTLTEMLNEPQYNATDYIKNIEISVKESTLESCDCPVCYCEHELSNIIETTCNHSYCKQCLVTHIKSFKNKLTLPSCPMCRKQIDALFTNNDALVNEVSTILSNI